MATISTQSWARLINSFDHWIISGVIFAIASWMQSFNSWMVLISIRYSFIILHKKKSNGVGSGDLAGLARGPPWPIHIPPWSKSSRNSFRKFKISSFIHRKWYCPLQSTPHRLQHTYASAWFSFRNISRTLLSAIRAVFDFSITSFRLLKRVPRNDFLIRSNRKNRRELYRVNSMTVGWYSFRSWSKIHG